MEWAWNTVSSVSLWPMSRGRLPAGGRWKRIPITTWRIRPSSRKHLFTWPLILPTAMSIAAEPSGFTVRPVNRPPSGGLFGGGNNKVQSAVFCCYVKSLVYGLKTHRDAEQHDQPRADGFSPEGVAGSGFYFVPQW